MGLDTPETAEANSVKKIRSERRRTGWEAPGLTSTGEMGRKDLGVESLSHGQQVVIPFF